MPTTYEQLERYLTEDEVAYERVESGLQVLFATNHYMNQQDGRQSLPVYVFVADDGDAVDIVAPRVYDLRTAVHAGAVCELLLSINFQTRSFRWEVDRRDGEVRGRLSPPLGGAPITHEAFRRLLGLMPRTVDFWHPVIQRVIATGTLPPPPPSFRTDPRLERAIEDAGGLDGLRDLFKPFGSGDA